MRMLAHPRFRAAFDFLAIRLAGSDSHAADVEYWRELQASGEGAQAVASGSGPRAPRFDGDGDGATEDDPDSPAPQRRRRRRRRPATSGQG